MATTKHNRRRTDRIRSAIGGWMRLPKGGMPRGGLGWALVATLVVIVALAAWKGPRLRADAVTGASFGARVACSCRYIEGRPLAACKKDFEPGMNLVMLSEDSSAKSVTARFPLLASQTATYQAGAGCVLEKW